MASTKAKINGEWIDISTKGSTGTAGKDGTSVSVSSVSESTEDGGSNVVAFSDGKTVTIKNGSKGSTGDDGTDGKSAYSYAQDGGYTGTEEEFSEKLAAEIPNVPDWAKQPDKPTYTAEEVGAMPADASVVKSVNGTVPDESGNVEIEAGGSDLSLGLTGAEVGQIARITAVDSDGKPTAWEPVDMPSGDKWELLNSITISETVNTVELTVDSDGNPLSLKKAIVMCVIERDMENPPTSIKTLVNGIQVSNNYAFNNTTPTKLYFYNRFELVPGFGITCEGTLTNFNYNWEYSIRKMGYKNRADDKQQALTSFKIVSNDGNTNICASGSTIDIFGVRA